jgi:hypothetical protein
MLLSFEEQELIEKVVKLLEPFKRATIILSSESEPTLPAVMPLFKKMEGLLIETETDTTVIKKMKKVTRENIVGVMKKIRVKMNACQCCHSHRSFIRDSKT